MKFIFLMLVIFSSGVSADAQDDYAYYIKVGLEIPSAIPILLPGRFENTGRRGQGEERNAYQFSDQLFPKCYYKPVDCGYFKLFGKTENEYTLEKIDSELSVFVPKA